MPGRHAASVVRTEYNLEGCLPAHASLAKECAQTIRNGTLPVLLRLAYRLLTEVSPRLLWKAWRLWACRSRRALRAYRRAGFEAVSYEMLKRLD